MKRMNVKAYKISSGKSYALAKHKHFKGDCNAAPRIAAKKAIRDEVSGSKQLTDVAVS